MEPRSSFALTLCAWGSAASVLVIQATVWLSTGSWPQWRFGDGWALIGVPEPLSSSGPLRGIFHWVWSWPLVVGVFVCMAILSALISPSRRD
jgi:hypothetical protein